jgi:hypothetical protein
LFGRAGLSIITFPFAKGSPLSSTDWMRSGRLGSGQESL